MKKTLLLIFCSLFLVGCKKSDEEITKENINDIKDEMIRKDIDVDYYYIEEITDKSYKAKPKPVIKGKNNKYLITIEYEQVGTLNMPKVDKKIIIKEFD